MYNILAIKANVSSHLTLPITITPEHHTLLMQLQRHLHMCSWWSMVIFQHLSCRLQGIEKGLPHLWPFVISTNVPSPGNIIASPKSVSLTCGKFSSEKERWMLFGFMSRCTTWFFSKCLTKIMVVHQCVIQSTFQMCILHKGTQWLEFDYQDKCPLEGLKYRNWVIL